MSAYISEIQSPSRVAADAGVVVCGAEAMFPTMLEFAFADLMSRPPTYLGNYGEDVRRASCEMQCGTYMAAAGTIGGWGAFATSLAFGLLVSHPVGWTILGGATVGFLFGVPMGYLECVENCLGDDRDASGNIGSEGQSGLVRVR